MVSPLGADVVKGCITADLNLKDCDNLQDRDDAVLELRLALPLLHIQE